MSNVHNLWTIHVCTCMYTRCIPVYNSPQGSKDVLQESYESAQAFFRDCLKGMDSTIGVTIT